VSHQEPGRAPGSLDPEAEQEVDFGRYWRLLVARWWFPVVGLVAGALIGYAISLGGVRSYTASATVYLGQPYAAGGGTLQTLQTNPSTVDAIVNSESVIRRTASSCNGKPGDVRNGISTEPIAGALDKAGQNPIMKISVSSRHAKEAACVADGLAAEVVGRVGGYARAKIANFQRRINSDAESISIIEKGISSPDVSTTDKLLFQLQLRNQQEDQIAAGQLLNQAQEVEAPKVLTAASAAKATARSRRNTVVVAALIGLVIGTLLALFWDRVAPRLARRTAA
jgi:hypothetical protein